MRDPKKSTFRNDRDRKVIELARSVEKDPGIVTFLKRAAVLHGDAVIFADMLPQSPDDAPPATTTRTASGVRMPIQPESPPPLLVTERVMLTRDGQVVGEMPTEWNLPFARSLLDELLRHEASEPKALADALLFVGSWYHAVAAYLFAHGLNGDSTGHLRQAERVLPDDPRLLFDRGTYAETFGLGIYQAVLEEEPANTGVTTRIPAEDKTNADAERMYRRVLEVDPTYIEARVRLARLLDRRGQHDEAALQIGTALEAKPTGVVAYYGRIVAGRIAAARGRYEEALGHYREAASLFAHAQSALLGASQAALMLADLPQIRVPLEQLADDPVADTDPWWDYQLGAGRDVDALLAALWAPLRRPGSR